MRNSIEIILFNTIFYVHTPAPNHTYMLEVLKNDNDI